jgi:hypothetical protein
LHILLCAGLPSQHMIYRRKSCRQAGGKAGSDHMLSDVLLYMYPTSQNHCTDIIIFALD